MSATAVHPFRRTATAVLTGALALAAGAVPLLIPGTAAAADTAVVHDGFDRTLTSGWGNPVTGSPWSGVVGGSGTSVANSEGSVKNLLGGRSFKAYQQGVSVKDLEMRVDFTVPVAANFQYTVETRKQADGSSYFGRARVDPAGKLHLDLMRNTGGTTVMVKEMTLDTPIAAGTRLNVRLSVTGASPVTLKGKIWAAGTTEPGWQVTALDSAAAAVTAAGYVGLQAYNAAGNPTVTLTTQAFVATDVSTRQSSVLTIEPSVGTTATRLAAKHGAAAVGTADYAAPADALYVSPSGNDTFPGTKDKPFKTLNKALTKNWSGQTIVLREGTYHESVLVAPGRAATIQPAAGEKVWFDGTKAISGGFTRSGANYVAGGYDVDLDSGPTYTKGQADSTKPGWQFVNPERPMAAHPDMVWVGDVEQKQVGSQAALVPGSFYVDQAADKLYLGSDPGTAEVRFSDLQTAFSLRAPGTVLRGFGIRRFANSVWQQGVVTSYYERQTLDNMTIADSATGGIGFFKPGSAIKNTTVSGSGQLAVHVNEADGLVMDNLSVIDSNDEGFNPAPSAGGIKVTHTRGVTLRNSEILRSNGNQFWSDESTFDTRLIGNEILDGTRYGVILEISSTATVVNNVIANNAAEGIMVQGTDKVDIWNNTIVDNRKAVAFAQDSRRIEQLAVAGHDDRRPQPDLTMPWVIGNSTVSNNILSAGRDAKAVLSVESYELAFNASDLNIKINGNVYSQTAVGAQENLVVWARKGAQPLGFMTLDDVTGNVRQEKSGLSTVGSAAVTPAYVAKSVVASRAATVAQPLPDHLAGRAGKTVGEQALGAWARPAS